MTCKPLSVYNCDPESDGKPRCRLGVIRDPRGYKYAHTVQVKGASGTEISRKARDNIEREYDIVIVGEAPGAQEDKSGIPFVGDAGDILIDFLDRAGFDLDRVYITNAVKCRPPKNRNPSTEELKQCFIHIDHELRTIKPKVVILTGRIPLRIFKITDSITNIHGKLYQKKLPGWEDGPDFLIVPTFHPAMFLHRPNPQLKVRATDDYIFAKNLLEGGAEAKRFYRCEYKLCDTVSKVRKAVKKIKEKNVFSFDTESASLGIEKNPMIMIQLSQGKGKTWVIPFYRHDPEGLDWKLKPQWNNEEREEVINLLKELFEDEKIQQIAHNIKYDINVIEYHLGIQTKGFLWDTACLKGNVEVLTPKGWVYLKDLDSASSVMQWSPNTKEAKFVRPTKHIKLNYSGKLIRGKGKNHNCSYTPEHRIPLMWCNSNKLNVFRATEILDFSSWRMPVSGYWEGGDVSFPQARLAAAIQADGEIRKNNRVWFELKKKTKIDRLTKLCYRFDVEFKVYSTKRQTTLFCLKGKDIDESLRVLTNKKIFGEWIYSLDKGSVLELFDEIKYWDSHYQGENSFTYTSKYRENVQAVATLAHLLGMRAKTNQQKAIWSVNISPQQFAHCKKEHFEYEEYYGYVYCLEVPSSFFFIRSNGTILVTGNCISHLLDARLARSLEFLGDLEFATGNWEEEVAGIVGRGREKNHTYDHIPDSIFHQYAATDAEITFRLFQLVLPRLTQKKRLFDLYIKHVHPLIRTLAKAEQAGNYINLDALNLLANDCDERIERLIRECRELTKPDFNPGSHQQVKDAFLDLGMGESIVATHKATGYSTDKATLSEIDHPLAKSVLEYRKVSKLKTTYVDRVLADIGPDNRIRYSFNIGGTVSGRLSARFLHQIERIDKEKLKEGRVVLRDIFGEEDDFYYFYSDYCLAPGTKVLRDNLTWDAIENLREGDTLVGIDEFRPGKFKRRKTRKVTVKKICKRVAPCYEIIMNDGRSLISSDEHPWLAKKRYKSSSGFYSWIKTKDLKVGMSIADLGRPWETDSSYEAGYLSGIYDGEGNIDKPYRIGFGQKEGKTLEKVKNILSSKGYQFWMGKNSSGVTTLEIWSKDAIKFLGAIRPGRLFGNKDKFLYGHGLPARASDDINIISIKFLGEREVVSIRTDAHTFVANGFFTHNSQIELRIFAVLTGEQALLDLLADPDADFHSLTAAGALGIDQSQVSDFNRSNVGKRLNFGIIYGSEGYSISKGTYETPDKQIRVIGLSRAQGMVRSLHQRFPKIKEYLEDVIIQANARGNKLSSVFGRELSFPEMSSEIEYIRKESERQAVNFTVQSPAGDITNQTMYLVDQKLEEAGIGMDKIRLLNTVHDSISYGCHKDYLDLFYPIFKSIAERPIPELNNYSFLVKCGWSINSWREAELDA